MLQGYHHQRSVTQIVTISSVRFDSKSNHSNNFWLEISDFRKLKVILITVWNERNGR